MHPQYIFILPYILFVLLKATGTPPGIVYLVIKMIYFLIIK